MIDANMKWNAREAIQLACRVEEAGLFWFEEPIEADDVDSHVDLARENDDSDRCWRDDLQ